MEEKSLAIAFGNSLKEDTVSIAGDIAEVGLDSILEDGLLKDIPIVSVAVAIYKIGTSLKERHNLKKLSIFIGEINRRICDDQKREEYKARFQSNDKFRNQEIEYLLVLIDRYISYDKPTMLAKLYIAYLDGIIIWEELTMYAEVVDRFFLLDFRTLISDADEIIVHRNIGGESVQRLVALGLMAETTNTSPFVEHGNGNVGITWDSVKNFDTQNKKYRKTEFGEKLAVILR